MKKKIGHLLEAVLFVIVILAVFLRINDIVRKKLQSNDTIASFYDVPRNTLDVLFVGSSHAYYGFSPMEMWKENGFTSYVMGSPSQSIPMSYFLIKEGIRRQKPKVIVLETYGSFYTGSRINPARLHVMLDPIPLGPNRIQALRELIPMTDLETQEDVIGMWLPITVYHSRWKKLREVEYHPLKTFLKGYKFGSVKKEYEEPKYITKTEELDETVLEYTDRIIKLCRDHDIPLVFCRLPVAYNNKVNRMLRRANALIRYVEDQGVEVIDFEQLRSEVPFHYKTDFTDATHLSFYGAERASLYLSHTLSQAYDLPDHRGDAKYASWAEDAAAYDSYRDDVFKEGVEEEEEEDPE